MSGFVSYDELTGPQLDPARWVPARLPLPSGDVHVPLDENAQLAVGDGEIRVAIPRFSLSHDTFQTADSPKYLIFGTLRYELPPDRPVTFAADLAVENVGGDPGDYRRGMAASTSSTSSDQARVRGPRDLHPGARAARAAGLGGGGRASRSTTWSSRRTRTSARTSRGCHV